MEMIEEADTADAGAVTTEQDPAKVQTAAEKAQVAKLIRTIKGDKEYHSKAFKLMRRDMHVAKYGATKEWPEGNYRANLAGRQVKMKTAALYAKNPKVKAKRRETLDFAMWDENPDTLMLAMQTVQNAAALAQQPPEAAGVDPLTGQPAPSATQLPEGFEQAQSLIADFKQGQDRREQIVKLSKTLEILFDHAVLEQRPLDFKMGMKKLVRRACTTAVGYVEVGFQRETGPRPGLTEQLADARARIDHLSRLAHDIADEEIAQDDAEVAELKASVESLMAEPEIVLREGLIFDFPVSTKVIPDRLCKELVGFVGARHVTIEYLFTPDEVQEIFDCDLDGKFKAHRDNGKDDDVDQPNRVADDEGNYPQTDDQNNGLVCVWKHYDKPSGLVSFVADGYDAFLRAPAKPDVFVADFWPVYALTFNDVEHEDELFPPSDVALMLDMQMEHNRSRQGKREHRQAARPRWGHPEGALDVEDARKLATAKPFENIGLKGMQPGSKVSDLLQPIPVPGVDPNLYDTGENFTDIQLVVGASEAAFGGTSKATATESAIAANSSNSSDGSAVDDLDNFLSVIARASGQILLKEMSPEQVMRVVGPGAFWPEMTLADIADEIYLDIQAGSTGKPNQAVEINNWKTMAPLLMQMKGVNPHWLARETIRRLDDDADLTEALAESLPSIVAQNQADGAAGQAAAQGQPQVDQGLTPQSQQGAHGAQNAPKPPGESGSGPAFGSNQV